PRQGPRGRRGIRGFLPPLRPGQPPAPLTDSLQCRGDHEPGGALASAVYARVLRRARRCGLPGPRPAVHRGDAARRLNPGGADPAGAAECQDHRRAPSPARLLLLGIQATFRARAEFQLRPGGRGPLLSRLRRADGALRPGAPRKGAPRPLRIAGREYRERSARTARVLRPAVRGAVPALLRKRARGAHRQFRAGAPTDLPRRAGAVASLRTVARTLEDGARAGAGRLSGGTGTAGHAT